MTASLIAEPTAVMVAGSAPADLAAPQLEVERRLEAMRAQVAAKQTEQPLDPDWLFGEAYFERRKEDA